MGNSLVDERTGPAAVDTLGPLHPVNRVRELERQVAALHRELAYELRVMRGVYLNQPPDGEAAEDAVDFSHKGRLRLTSEDGSVDITKGTLEDPHTVDLAASGGCEVAYSQVDGDTGSCTAVDCDSVISIVGGTCIDTAVTCSSGDATVTISYAGNHYAVIQGDLGQANADGCDDTLQIVGDGLYTCTTAADGSPDSLSITLCFPLTEAPVMGVEPWQPDPPAGWIQLPAGVCNGQCTPVKVPYWL